MGKSTQYAIVTNQAAIRKSSDDQQSKQFVEPSTKDGVAAKLQKAAREARDEGHLSQAEKFEQAARDLGADQNEEAFKGVLRKLAKPKAS